MYGCSEADITSVVPEDPVPTLAPHIHICAEALSPALQTCKSTSLSPARTKSSKGVGEDKINAMHPITSLVHSVLGNFAIAMSLISFIVFTVFFAMTWLTVLRGARSMIDQALSNATGVSILGHGLQLDLDAYVLSISWVIVVCDARIIPGVLSRSYDHVPVGCKPFDRALDVYLNDLSTPVLSFTPYTEPISSRLGVLDPLKFTMDHQFNKRGEWDSTQDLMVPFEHYGFHTSALAIDPLTNNSVQIATFCILDTLGDFFIRSYDATDTTKFTHESKDGLVATEVESRALRVEIERSTIAKVFMICLFLGNWAATVSSVYTTALVVVGKLEANSMIAALPFSALVVIPTIRSLYTTSPPLGFSVDAVAFLVQIVTTGLCSLVMLRVLTRCGSSNTTGSPV